jgi:hypothetical protein
MMSPSGMMLKKSILESMYNRDSKDARSVHEVEAADSGCAFMSISVW